MVSLRISAPLREKQLFHAENAKNAERLFSIKFKKQTNQAVGGVGVLCADFLTCRAVVHSASLMGLSKLNNKVAARALTSNKFAVIFRNFFLKTLAA
jgi:hypothetical protein